MKYLWTVHQPGAHYGCYGYADNYYIERSLAQQYFSIYGIIVAALVSWYNVCSGKEGFNVW